MIRMLARLTRETRGAATVEFAFLTVFFFGIVMAGLDVAMFFIQQSRMTEAVSSASVAAFASRSAVSFDQIPTIVQQGARAPAGTTVSVNVVCNGMSNTPCTNNTNRQCTCIALNGATMGPMACTDSCPSTGVSADAKPGYYLTINASYSYQPIVLPRGLLTGKTVQRSITQRLQ